MHITNTFLEVKQLTFLFHSAFTLPENKTKTETETDNCITSTENPMGICVIICLCAV